MTIILQLPPVERNNFMRPQHCPSCKGETFQGWGTVKKRIRDTKVRKVRVRRYRCTTCRRTFRHYPQGVTAAQQSERLMKLCVVMWSLGLSYRSVAVILGAFGLSLSHMSGWRDVQAAGQRILRRMTWEPARVVGVDGAWLNGTGILGAVDLGDGHLPEIAEIDEKDKEQLKGWLQHLKQKHAIGALVTDDLASYKELADELQVGHPICQFHVRRWVGRALKKLEPEIAPEWQYVLEVVRTQVADLPTQGGQHLYTLWKQMSGRTTRPEEERTALEKLRDLVLRLSRDWPRYIAFSDDSGIPWTNNATERIMGRLKNRAKRVRGYKSSRGRLNGCLIACQTWI